MGFKNSRCPLPLKIEEVTTEWLSQALTEWYPGVEVTGLQIEEILNGSATKLRLHLDYNDEGRRQGLPASAWLKGGFEQHVFGDTGSYIAEARFFSTWAQHLTIDIPKCYYAGADPNGRQGLVLLEDLNRRGAIYGRATAPLSPEAVAAVLAFQARYHAQWWAAEKLSTLRSYTDRFAAADYFVSKILEPTYYASCVRSPRGETTPRALREAHGLLRALHALWEFTRTGTHCFVHGDAHLGNFYFNTDRSTGLLDWQAYIHCQPMHDVTYFLIGALTTENRRAHERDLIGGYLGALGSLGVVGVPDFDTAWQAHRRFAIHGFIWIATPVQMQPEDVIQSYAQRFGAACTDLDTVKALGL